MMIHTNAYITPLAKAAPTTCLSLLTQPASSAPTSPPSKSIIKSALELVAYQPLASLALHTPSAPQQSQVQSVLFTCLRCYTLKTLSPSVEQSTPVCRKCMQRFQRRETAERERDRLTSFPCLLEPHARVRQRRREQPEEGEEENGCWKRVIDVVLGVGKKEKNQGKIKYVSRRKSSETIGLKKSSRATIKSI
ncbi:hypothetical protein GQ44DRAFT_165910 [Phaeosphaeriaceae sp. PMI808]|nr:hypothetical protein GQ44DRAFT_165910 [Phaeosphaeriaceae sp. PMI808]